tara:strand:- start:106 stop:300 length:195 start_codon:yes stop_codon:yes gene_type:complete
MATKIDIETTAAQPATVKGDAGEVQQHSLKDQIEADQYLNSKEGVDKTSHRGMRFNKLKAGSAV